MSGERQISGNQGAMIYLAESLAGLKHEQAQTNLLLRELIELARLGASGSGGGDDDQGDEIAGLRSFLTPVPNGGGGGTQTTK